MARVGMLAALAILVLAASVTVAQGGAGPRPSISGDAFVGSTLRSTLVADVYRWQRCDPATTTCGDNTDRDDPAYVNIPGGAANDRAYSPTPTDLGMVIRLQAKSTSLGSQFVPSAPVGPVVEGPELRESAVLDPACALTVIEPGSPRKIVDELSNVDVGTRINVSRCQAQLITVRNSTGKTQSVAVAGSGFKFGQRAQGRPIVVLKLVGEFTKKPTATLGAGPSSSLAQAAGKAFKRCKKIFGKKKCRKLVAQGDCLCSTSGAFASGTVRGSKWYVQDGPGYTYAKAVVHKLLVRDRLRKKKVLLKPGQHYIARKGRALGACSAWSPGVC